ncbi:YadA-like family protein [Moraxella pluranimalium]|uniref:Autotransporter adhesin n=1 Tax=Moraxella pluranimalium TaxID=470453 RepID=A0A1T0CU98_9GAMM|nr:YadA-like family protein [Moraxella pluranimalium]OOS25934.1 hypothetical protein B0680_00805 [Moraxella pluranimalium]
MNKVYKVVWNYSTQKWVAVSELAKGRVKSSVGNECKQMTLFKISPLKVAVMLSLGVFTTNAFAAIAEGTLNGTTNSDVLNYNTVNNLAGPGASGTNYATAVAAIPIGSGSQANQGGVVVGSKSTANALAVAVGSAATANGSSAVALGAATLAQGVNSLAIMRQAGATGNYSMAIGTAAATTGEAGIGIGKSVLSSGTRAIAIGSATNSSTNNYNASTNTQATATDSIAIGTKARAAAASSVVIGVNASGGSGAAGQMNSIAVGANSTAAHNNATAIGYCATTSGVDAIAVGSNAVATINATAIGLNATASVDRSLAVGENTKATAGQSIALGSTLNISGSQAIGLGNNMNITGEGAIGIGGDDFGTATSYTVAGQTITLASAYRETQSSGRGSVAVGTQAQSTGDFASTLGAHSSAVKGATALGAFSDATSEGTVAVGLNATASQANATAIGANATASHYRTVAIGLDSTATYMNATAIGSLAHADKEDAIAIGAKANTTGNSAVAIGKSANSSAQNSIAIGNGEGKTGASGDNSIVLGAYGVANQSNATAIGRTANAVAQDAIAIGRQANASLAGSLALGNGSVTGMSVPDTTLSYNFANDAGANVLPNTQKAANSTVSVGTSSYQRKIINLAAGAVTATSTEAINGSQLYDVVTKVGFNIQENGAAKSRINNNNIVNFADGTYTTASVTDGTNSSTVKFNVVNQAITTTNGVASATGAAGLATSADVVNAVNNTGFNLQANGADGSFIKSGNTVNIAQGSNIVVSKSGNTVTVATSKTPIFDSVETTSLITGRAEIQGELEVAGEAVFQGGITVDGVQTVDMGGNPINNVAEGVYDTDAVNVSQLKANATKVVAGKNVSVSDSKSADGTTYTINANDTSASVSSDSTLLTVTANGTKANGDTTVTDYKVSLTQGSFGTPTTGALVGGTTGVATTADVVTAVNSGYWKVGNNAGAKTAEIKFGDQVNFVNGSGTLSNVTGANVSFDVNVDGKTITVGNDGKLAVNTSALPKGVSVEAGNHTTVTSKAGSAGETIYVVDAEKTTATAGSDAVKVTAGTKDAIGVTNYTVDLSDTTKEQLAKANTAIQNFTTSVNGAKVETITKDNNDVGFVNGTGTTARDDNGNITFDINKANLSTDATGTVSSDKSGNSFATATNVAEAINSASTTLTNKGLNFTGNDGTTARKLGETLNITGTASTAGAYSSANVKTVVTDGKVEIQIADNPVFENITAQNVNATNVNATNVNATTVNATDVTTTTLTTTGDATIGGELVTQGGIRVEGTQTIDMGGNQINNVKAGTLDTDAVNLAQLNSTVANSGWTVKANGDAGERINNNGEVNFIQGDNIVITRTGSDITVKTVDSPNFTTVNATTVNATTVNATNVNATNVTTTDLTATGNTTVNNFTVQNGATVDMGNNVVTNVANGTKATDAVNKGQLDEVAGTANTAIQNFTTSVNGAKVETITKDNNDVGFVNGTGTTARDDNGNITFDINKANLSTDATGTVSSDKSGNSFATANDVANAINNASKAAKTEVKAGDNIVVTNTTGSDGQTVYTVATSKDLTVDSITAGDTTITTDGVTIANGPSITKSGINANNTVITNVAAGTNATDVVNVSQLQGMGNYFNQQIEDMRNHVNIVEDNLEAGLAGARAIAALPQVSRPGASMLAVGLGSYADKGAIAVGFSSISDNGKLTMKVNVDANTENKFGAGVGMGWEW